jgi:cytochrome c biogenesis protein CcmG/thiol:disulfide interchange protein DsbE
MKRSFVRSPYFWAIVAVAAVVGFAWMGRESYRPVITGAEAPDFAYASIDGDEVSLADYLGEKVVLVNVWATWCGPCVVEMPSMQRLYESLEGEDFEILAVSVDAPLGQADVAGRPGGDLRQFTEDLGLTFPILHDPANSISELYQTTGVPESFVVGKDGVIYKKVAGPTEWDAAVNEELVRRLLSAK